MENAINQTITVFRTYNSKILSDKNIKNLSKMNFSDTFSTKANIDNSVSTKDETEKIIRENRIKYSTTDKNRIVVQVVRDGSGKIIRTIPLNEQHALDFFK
tara:strand:+ start:710 stop:1012 length:303 start_codon:yes stop_codon:yes gene_type:complete